MSTHIPISIPTIENAIQSEVVCTSQELDVICEEVRGAIARHVLQFALVPQGIFQMRLMTAKERSTETPIDKQTYLVVSFGEQTPEEGYREFLDSYYGKVLFLHFQLHHTLCL